jgi:hypothetical protein
VGQWIPLGAHRMDYELCLSTFPMRGDDKLPGDAIGDLDTMVAPDDVQTKIKAGSASGRGENVSIVYIKDIRVDVDARVFLRQDLCVCPMRSGAPAIEHSGCS